MGVLSGCFDARNMVEIAEEPCPRCGAPIEVFIRDGRRINDSTCDHCGFLLPEEEPLEVLSPKGPPSQP